jgi:hypothetical protein
MGLLEPNDDIGKSRVPSKYEPVPKRPGSVAELTEELVKRNQEARHWAHLLLLCCDGIREAKERQCQINEAVFILLQFLLLVDDLAKSMSTGWHKLELPR